MLNPCYMCGGVQNLKEYDEDSTVCTKCYEDNRAQLHEYNMNRDLHPDFNQIIERLYLGNEDTARHRPTLDALGITAICVCGSHLEKPFFKNPDFVYRSHQIDDFPKQSIINLFGPTNEWITACLLQGRSVLLHCAAGVSRSASFTIAFLMFSRRIPLIAAVQLVKSKRPVIHPNEGFMSQLKQYQQQLGIEEPKLQ